MFFLLTALCAAFVVWIASLYFFFTVSVPQYGGEYSEGMVGQPLYINPLLSQASEADASLVSLVYSGLMHYDRAGRLENDLADHVEVSDDRKTYSVFLRPGVSWHDDEPLTAADVVFTVQTIQNQAYRSPLRQNWQGVEVVAESDSLVRFSLKNPYFGFLDNLTVGILPKHVWEDVSPEKFSLVEFNRQPVGTGPYMVDDFQVDSSGNILEYGLVANEAYHLGQPFIHRLTIDFFPNEQLMFDAFEKKDILGMSNVSPERWNQILVGENVTLHMLHVPRLFSVFFNQTKSVPLAHDEVREALALGTNRTEIVDRVLNRTGDEAYAPFTAQMRAFHKEFSQPNYDPDRAKAILDENGWQVGEDGIRTKEGTRLEFQLLTADWNELERTGDELQRQWREIGADVKISALGASDLQQNHIRPREYEALLFGQAMSFESDPYSFWHSSQRRDPGLNLSLMNNQEIDQKLESARQESNVDSRQEQFRSFQEIIRREYPAIFLYSPQYLYPVSKRVKGIEMENINNPADRFSMIHQWYVKTKRVWKN